MDNKTNTNKNPNPATKIVKKVLFGGKRYVRPKKPVETFEKVLMYLIIVNEGQGEPIINLLKDVGTSAQFTLLGQGTANRQVLNVLGVEDNKKEIVYTFIKEDMVEELTKELQAYFESNKKNRGIGFSIELNSMVGVKLYHFLTNTL